MMDSSTVRPTKLFIGGISRRTTTKHLRDHFSACGRVLDCVAMRQPDGRPRGFGYVTLDSPAAAEYFLSQPQMIDNRYVDLKPAVPDVGAGNASVGSSLQLTSCWPSHGTHQEFPRLPAAPCIGDASPLALLTCQTQPSMLPGPPPGLLEPPLLPNPLVTGELSEPRPPVQAFDTKMPLRDVTNLLNSSSGLKLPDVLAAKPATVQPSSLTMGYTDTGNSDDGDFFVLADEEEPEQESVLSPKPSSPRSSASANDENEPDNQQLLNAAEKLPSLGSANHDTGECRQCNFFAKGRCRNGHSCTFCHFPHQRKRQSCHEKREAPSAQLASSQATVESTWNQNDSSFFCGAAAGLPPPGLSPLPMHYGSMTHPMHSSCLAPHGTNAVPLLSTQPVLQSPLVPPAQATETPEQIPQRKEVATQTPPGGLGCRLCGKDTGFKVY